ncbi:hypothetical protein GLOIN_2v1773882 [Rhizophagus irregularis DAOM 181602=DAOM 197198]|nr:hypothetical protein GLOIN_2v1773882 [Rhizophagus irregularis DAOM 181602=DAOM 197198]
MGIATERTLSEIEKTICYISVAKVCMGQKTEGFEKVVQFRGTHLVRNQKNSNNVHEPFAILENQNQPHEAYRRLDCYLLVAEINICEKCKKLKDTLIKIKNQNLLNDLPVKVAHASQEILSKKVQFQRKKIANQNQTIHTLKNRIKQKVEEEGEKVLEELYQIAQDISRKVVKNKIDLSSLNPIFQELIRVQSGKANGIRYHIIQQHLGWQDKTACHILEKISIENIGDYGRIGFFSHDSFKIQKGLLWSQQDNCYVGYLDFENEKEELQSFAMQCEKELQTDNNTTCNFAYPIAYYGINTLTAHKINKILFHLATNLECICIHTYGSVCNGAGENRNHIKSFDWWASFWSVGDIVEVNIGKNNYEQARIISSTNLDHSKFTVCLLDPSFSNEFQVNCNSLRQPMPTKQNWNINDFCEFKSPKDNKWHTAIITNIGSETQTFIVTILSNNEKWNMVNKSQNIYIRPLYDTQTHWTNYKIINPITSTPCIREIMIDGNEVSWHHIQGVYDYTVQNSTAKLQDSQSVIFGLHLGAK